MQNRDFHQAIESFSKAIALKPDYGRAYDYRGIAYSETQNY